MAESTSVILGGGVTGIAAGITSGAPVYEAAPAPGGICASYYVRPGTTTRLPAAPDDGEAYRFELGGGHWIFGGDPSVLRLMSSHAPMSKYRRLSSVFFPGEDLHVPYPIQNHLGFLGSDIAARSISEVAAAPTGAPVTLEESLHQNFGKTLTDKFFGPFHQLYTAGLWKTVAPQDAYKSPASFSTMVRGAFEQTPDVGYNVTFVYPDQGLDSLFRSMASQCDVRYGKVAVEIDPKERTVSFSDGTTTDYSALLSTLPLNVMCELAGVKGTPDPYTSVLVVNIGAKRGKKCPDAHWIYVPESRTGFHRIGFYSNVAPHFLPRSTREDRSHVSIYVEMAFMPGNAPDAAARARIAKDVAAELVEWGIIEDPTVADPTWVDVAYTWSRPGSTWVRQSVSELESMGIYQVGRYARWVFQGIADSVRDGLVAGAALARAQPR